MSGIATEQQDVAAGPHRGNRRDIGAQVIGDRAHIEIVARDHSSIAELAAQQIADHGMR